MKKQNKAALWKRNKAARYAVASDRCDNYVTPRQSEFYVQDLLTQQPAEKDITKGWFRKRSTVQAAVDKMNAADTGGPYAEMSNGYVRKLTDQTDAEAALKALQSQRDASWCAARHDGKEFSRISALVRDLEDSLLQE